MKTLEEKLYIYVISMWYESRCKDKKMIKKIITEELKANKDMKFNKLGLKILRRCKSEL